MHTVTHNFKISPVDMEERKNLDVRPGDTVRIQLKIEEKGKIRLQPYEGLVIARKHGTEPGATITVRRTSSGVGMEKILPIYSPIIAKIEVIKRAKTRRSKLYYIRDKASKEARKKLKQLFGFSAFTASDDTIEKETPKDESPEKEADGAPTENSSEENTPQEAEKVSEEKTEEGAEDKKEE